MASREQKLKIAVFVKTFFSIITFDSVKARHSFCQNRVSLVETSLRNYILTLKAHIENLTSGQGQKRSCCISVDPYRQPEHIYGVVIALAGFDRNILPKSC